MTAIVIKDQIIAKAKDLGFDVIRFTKPNTIPHAAKGLKEYLLAGHHGDMDWMETTSDRRGDPLKLWPEAKSIIMLGMNYGPEHNPIDNLDKVKCGNISAYARGKDYHDILKKKLKTIARWLHMQSSQEVKVFVDTAPVMEKPLAVASGLGWQGKHTNLVSREFGSWLFLGCIFTTYDIAPDEGIRDHCGSCSRCLDICPTNAFPAPYKLDARKCIAYLTIEYKGHIPEVYRAQIGNRIFGCDDCLAVCPWNKYAKKSSEIRFHQRNETNLPKLSELLNLDDQTFRQLFAGTPIKRTGRDRFIRNVLIACGNSGDVSLIPEIQKLIEDISPLVRAMAVWACRILMTKEEFQDLKSLNFRKETDNVVLSEWS